MNTDTPPPPPAFKPFTANPNSKPGAGYGKPLGGNRGATANPNASAGAGYGRPVGTERPSMLGSKPTPSPAFTETPPSPALVKPPTSTPPSPAGVKPPTANPNSSPGAGYGKPLGENRGDTANPNSKPSAGYGRPVGTERPSMLGNKKDVLNSVRKKKQKSR